MSLAHAFGLSVEDVYAVLLLHRAAIVNRTGTHRDVLAEQIFDGWDDAIHDRVAAAALSAEATDDDEETLVAQVNAANDEIHKVLIEHGVLAC